MKRTVLLGLLLLFLAESVIAKDPVWFAKMIQIKLLQDNRERIVKHLGNPLDNATDSYIWDYDFKDGTMSVSFETGVCSENKDDYGRPIGWKVPEWTVVEVSFSPDQPIKPNRLRLNLNSFSKKPIAASGMMTPNDSQRAPYQFEYVNGLSGTYLFEEFGKFVEIARYPSKTYDALRCQ